jgi:hypothetical protein
MPERGPKMSTVSCLSIFWNFFGMGNPNDLMWQLVTIDKTWLYHYDPETKQQSMECQHSGSTHHKKFRVQKYTGEVLTSTFGDQEGLLNDYIPKGQTINAVYYSSLLVQLKYILKEKHQGKVFSCTTMPWLTGHLQPRRNWPTWASNVFITHPILQIWPRWTTTCSLDLHSLTFNSIL